MHHRCFSYLMTPLVVTLVLFSGCKSKGLSKSVAEETVASFIAPDSVDLCFFVLGDWGRKGLHGQTELGKTMAYFAEQLNPAFIISTGDNFYPDGVESIEDEHWKVSFEEPYGHQSLQTINWYTVLGNHDIRGNVQAQMDYNQVNPSWNLPAIYYHQTVAAGEDSLLLVYLETNSFATGYYQSDSYGPFVRAQDTTAQLAWLENLLRKHQDKPIIVFGHHPLYTAGARAGKSNSVRTHLEPRLEKYGVLAYIAGHEHDVQHINPEDKSVHHFVSGAGSALREIKDPKAAIFAKSTNAFMVVRILGTRTYMSFIDTEGNEIYRTALESNR